MVSDEQLIHLTRYIHLNPVTAYICERPEEWKASSYKEFISENDSDLNMCDFREWIGMDAKQYSRFCSDQINYQRELAKIKHLMFD